MTKINQIMRKKQGYYLFLISEELSDSGDKGKFSLLK
jgi:hypothetical protein